MSAFAREVIHASDVQLEQAARDGALCSCGSCFNCYVWKLDAAYRSEQLRFPEPPVPHFAWSKWDWLRWAVFDHSSGFHVEPTGDE